MTIKDRDTLERVKASSLKLGCWYCVVAEDGETLIVTRCLRCGALNIIEREDISPEGNVSSQAVCVDCDRTLGIVALDGWSEVVQHIEITD